MKKLLLIIIIIFTSSEIKSQTDEHSVEKLKEGDIAPNWSLKSESGDFEFLQNWTVKKNRQLRKPSIQPDRYIVLFTFFATWCPPCVEQLQPLEEVFQKYKNEKIKVFIIDVTEHTRKNMEKDWAINAPETKSLLADNKINIPYLEDEWNAGNKYGVNGIPTIFIIDKFGTIQNIRVGFTKEEEDLVGELSEIIDWLLLEQSQ